MPLPEFDESGDLPAGIYSSTIEEAIDRFGVGTPERIEIAGRLLRIHQLAKDTGYLSSLLLFGSFVTSKPAPRDVDVILIMENDFRVEDQQGEVASLFDHSLMENTFGASIFWVRPAMLLEPLETFRTGWQKKRDGGQRGIVEVIA